MKKLQYNNDDISITEGGTEKFIVNIRTGKLIKMNSIGLLIWNSIPGRNIEEITEEIFKQCNMEKETIKKDVHDFIEQLKLQQLILEII